MKKIFFSLLAIAALASCAKTEAVYTEADSEIKLAPVTSMVTKADVYKAIDGTTYPAEENFTVIGYWADEVAGTAFANGTTYLDAVDFAKKGNYWAGANEAYYWPKNGSLRFACYSPTVIDGGKLTHDLATDTWTATGYVQNNDTEETIDFMVAQTPVSYTAQTAAENVSVVFEHALSWLSFKVKAQDAAAAAAFDVKSITVNNVFTKGNMTAKYPAKDWTVTEGSEKAYAVCENAPALAVEAVDVDNTGILVIPQPTTTVTVTFTQNTLADVEQSIEIPLVLDDNTPWVAGKHYIYTLIFGLDEILINPSVADWEDVLVNDVPVTEEVATTAAELAAAINNGGMVRLGADITLNEVFRLSESVNIDLNGYTLTANAEDILFRVNEGATLTIGRGTINAAFYIVSVNKGGVAVVNDGTYKAAVTAVNVNGGQAYITGGSFEDTSEWNGQYLLNHIDALKNEGLIEVTGGSYKNFNPAAASSENPAMNFVAEGYNVTAEGDVYTVTATDANVTLAAATSAVTTYKVADALLDGAGQTLSAVQGVDYVISNTARLIEATAPATIKNIKIDGNSVYSDKYGIRGIYTIGTGDILVENVEILNCTYAINANNAGKLSVVNSTLQGWNSYGGTTENYFENVNFINGEFHNFRPYNNTVCVNCDFATGVVIDLSMMVEGATLKLDKCTYNGEEITAENYTTYVSDAKEGVVIF